MHYTTLKKLLKTLQPFHFTSMRFSTECSNTLFKIHSFYQNSSFVHQQYSSDIQNTKSWKYSFSGSVAFHKNTLYLWHRMYFDLNQTKELLHRIIFRIHKMDNEVKLRIHTHNGNDPKLFIIKCLLSPVKLWIWRNNYLTQEQWHKVMCLHFSSTSHIMSHEYWKGCV